MEYLTSGWVNFQSATLGQFCIGGYKATTFGKPTAEEEGEDLSAYLVETNQWQRLLPVIYRRHLRRERGR